MGEREELQALRDYFNAHMEMHNAIKEDAFAKAAAKANNARDTLIRLSGEQAVSTECASGADAGSAG